jgi:hypothetical protein
VAVTIWPGGVPVNGTRRVGVNAPRFEAASDSDVNLRLEGNVHSGMANGPVT